ncbi:hypothetical protein PsYK624_059180 [Phanerochaete sordida]|uniref:Uncharacterized protein n=1 Tax=Phanerochaete sordida TaxID=48140 RepID=A0A9P3G8F6_9APHY|nr:hypothetical protein PsYK624_059180 [Phanerochaete sordida]
MRQAGLLVVLLDVREQRVGVGTVRVLAVLLNVSPGYNVTSSAASMVCCGPNLRTRRAAGRFEPGRKSSLSTTRR